MTDSPLTPTPARLIAPYGGRLVNLMVEPNDRAAAIDRAARMASIQLSPRSMCDLELMATGAFSPLNQSWVRPTTGA